MFEVFVDLSLPFIKISPYLLTMVSLRQEVWWHFYNGAERNRHTVLGRKLSGLYSFTPTRGIVPHFVSLGQEVRGNITKVLMFFQRFIWNSTNICFDWLPWNAQYFIFPFSKTNKQVTLRHVVCPLVI